jgi:hypothetical protein
MGHPGQKKTARLFGAGGFSDSVGCRLAGPFRQQAGEVEEKAEKEPVSHRPGLNHTETAFGKFSRPGPQAFDRIRGNSHGFEPQALRRAFS